MLKRNDDGVLRVAPDLEVSDKRKRGGPKKTWKKQVEKETGKTGLNKDDAPSRAKWRDRVQANAESVG